MVTSANIQKLKKPTDDREVVDIIIPTYDNLDLLEQCISSMYNYRREQPFRVIIVNNGKSKIYSKYLEENEHIVILEMGQNLGWAGGLIEGLKHSKSKYVMFANDDIFIPRASFKWLECLVDYMEKVPFCGAVGPSSNCVSGAQNIWHPLNMNSALTSYLIGFCILVRREALDKAGGVHIPEVGGDDFDLSIRLRDAGYALSIKKEVFVFHHGFVTGTKLNGGPEKHGGWNSQQMIENTNMEIIRKHGYEKFWLTMQNNILKEFLNEAFKERESDVDDEGEQVRRFIEGDNILELGCGSRKTVPNAIGVDLVAGGDMIPYENFISVADIQADITQPLPFDDGSVDTIVARHILEHCLDSLGTLKNWRKPLKKGGRLIIACPDEREVRGIPLNSNHLHAFTPDTTLGLANIAGFKETGRIEKFNGISFVMALEAI